MSMNGSILLSMHRFFTQGKQSPLAGIFLLSALVTLNLGLWENFGMYSAHALLWVIGSFCCLLLSAIFALQHFSQLDAIPEKALASALLLFLLTGATKVPLMYSTSQKYAVIFFYVQVLLALSIMLFYIFSSANDRHVKIFFFATILAAFVLRVSVPLVSPTPTIDVFVVLQESLKNLIHGENPYLTQISDVYRGAANFGYDIVGYYYPPATLYALLIGYVLFEDARYTLILAEALTAALLWTVGRRHLSLRATQLLLLLFLFQPRSLFVLEQAWIEPLLLLAFALFLWCHEQGKRGQAALAYGYLLSLKQNTMFFALQWLFLERRWQNIILAIAITLSTIVPFLLIMSPQAFWHALTFIHTTAEFRSDSLSLSTPLYHLFGIALPKVTGLLAAGVATLVAAILSHGRMNLREYLFAISLTMFTMFLFGSQAYANYYYLVSGLLLFLLPFIHSPQERDHFLGLR